MVGMKLCIVAGMTLSLALLAACNRQPAAGGRKLNDWLEVVKRSNDPQELIAAADALAVLGPEAAPASYELVRMMADREWFAHYRKLTPAQVGQVFAAYGRTLNAMGPAVVPTVLQFLEYDRPVSADVVNSLSAEAVPALANGLHHPEPKVRAGVAVALGTLGRRGSAAAPQLLKMARDRDESVRKVAVKALGLVSTDPAAAAPVLIAALKDESVWVRVAATEGLQGLQHNDEAVVQALVAQLADKEPLVRGASAATLGSLGGSVSAVPALVNLLGDPSTNNQRHALHALAKIRPLQPAAAPAIVGRLAAGDGEAAATLRGLGADAAAAVPAIAETMRRRGFRDNGLYAPVLASVGAAAVPTLIELLRYRVAGANAEFATNTEEGWPARIVAAEALGAMGATAKPALPVLKEVMGTERRAEVVAAARKAIKQIESVQ